MLHLKRIRGFFEKAKWIDNFLPFNLDRSAYYLDEQSWKQITGVEASAREVSGTGGQYGVIQPDNQVLHI